jgi:hypothetical protein
MRDAVSSHSVSTRAQAKTALAALPCEHGPNAMCARCLPPTTDADLDVETECLRCGGRVLSPHD